MSVFDHFWGLALEVLIDIVDLFIECDSRLNCVKGTFAWKRAFFFGIILREKFV